MPRIRKKTSKRGTTHKRSRIKAKVAESRKKAKKAEKTNPQWKSKQPKDPGIPNNFPYKAEILAEVAVQRRQEEEERQKRKEQRKAEKAAAKAGNAEEDKDAAQTEENATGFDGISSVGTSILKISPKASSAKGKERTVMEEEDIPILMNSEYTDLKSVLDKADVVVQVLDARDPLAYQSIHLHRYVDDERKLKTIFILNKIDTCPRETVQSWLVILRKQHPTFLFRPASAFLPKVEEQGTLSASKVEQAASDAVGVSALLKALATEATKKTDGPLTVALVGVANTGKSSIMNSLLGKSVSPIYKLSSAPSRPSTTERALDATLEYEGKQIKVIDTPALAWIAPADLEGSEASKLRAKDVLLRSKGRIDRVKEPLIPVAEIIARANAEDLMVFYTLPAFPPGDTTAFLSALARKRGLVKKHGEADLIGAARIVLRDWSTGRLPRFAAPPPRATDVDAGSVFENGVQEDEELLKAAPLRKERRKGRGIVRLTPGSPETREVALDIPYDEEEEEEDDEESSEEEEGEEDLEASMDDEEEISQLSEAELDDDENEQEGSSEEDSDDVPLPSQLNGKRKRPGNPTGSPSSKTKTKKKVAFAALPTNPKPKNVRRMQSQSSVVRSKTKPSPKHKAKRLRR